VTSPDAAPLGGDVTEPRPSRIETRRRAEALAEAERRSRSVLRAWWIYPLVSALVVCLYLGVQSATTGRPTDPTVVTTVPAAP
jgi:hypothetical protein